jgi:predicted nucleotidyltransferase
MARFDSAQAAMLIEAARRDADFTQAELAERAGITQPNLASMEAGKRRPSPEMLERILAAADYRPSVALSMRIADILAAVNRSGLAEPRVFGSVLRGEDHFDSDIDLFVSAPPGSGLFPLAALAADIEELTGFRADVVATGSAEKTELGRKLLEEAAPL